MAFQPDHRPDLAALEKKIADYEHSNRALIGAFIPIHEWLRMKSRWYYNWHSKPNRSKLHGWIAAAYAVGAVFTFINFSLYYGVNSAAAASYTWDGGGATNNWSDCDNWSSDVCPTSADAITFNGTSTKNSTVDASFAGVITSISINSGYTGTITLARTLNTTSTGATSFSQAAGTFTAANQTLDIDGTFALSAGTFTASSGSSVIGGDLVITGSPTFNHNSGTITFDGGTKALACNNVTFNLVVFNATATKTIGSACTVPLGSNPTMPNSLTVNGTLSGSGTLSLTGTSTTTFNAGATLTGFTGFVNNGGTTISGATINFGSYSTVDLNSTFTLSSGTFTAPSGTMTIATGFTVSGSPTFNANGGTITFDGVSGTLSCNNVTFNLVTFNHTSSKTVNSNCSLPLGNNPSSFPAVVLNGTLSGSGTLTTSGTFTLNAGAALSGFSGLNVSAITIAGATTDLSGFTSFTSSSTVTVSSGSLTLPNGADLNGPFTITGGTFNAPSGTMTVAGNMTISGSPTFNANSGTVTFDGAGTTLSCNNVTFNLVTFNHTGTKSVSSNCSLPLGTNPVVPSGITLTGSLSGTGTLTVSTGTFSFISGYTLSGFTALLVNAMAVSNATVDLSSFTSVVTNNTTTIGSGIVIPPSSGSWTANNTLTVSGGTFSGNAGTLDLNGGLTISSGTFTAPSDTMTVAGAFTISSGATFNHNNGTITFDGTSGGAITCNNASFNRVNLLHTSSAKSLNNCTLPLGDNPTVTGPITFISGSLTGSGTLTNTHTSSNAFRIQNSSPFAGFNGLSVSGHISVRNNATLDLSSYSQVTIYGTSASAAISLLEGGVFIAPSGTMTLHDTLAGDDTSTFTHSNGSVEFILSDDADTIVIQGANHTFNNLSVLGTSGNNFRFDSGYTQTILGAFSLKGTDSSKVLEVTTDEAGSVASIDPRGTRTVQYASIRDITNINANTIAAGNGTVTNLGNNSGWNFHTPTVTALGPATMTNGSKITDTTPDFTFTLADSDANDTVMYQIQVDNNSDFSSPTIDATSSSMAPAATTYTATKALADGNYYWRVRTTDTAGQSSEWAVANSGNVAFSLGESKPVSTPSPTPSPNLEVTDATAETGTEDNPGQRFTVVIRLLDANKQPIVGAKVTLRSEPKETVSDSEGYARFEDVELGEHTLTVEHNGQVGEQKIAITEDTVANLDPDKEGTISITVELKNVEAAPTQSRVMYALYGVTGALALIFIAMLIMLRRRTQSIVPKY